MALEDTTIIIFIAMAFNYLVIYRKNRLLGNIGFLLAGLAIMAFNTGDVYASMGLFIVLGSVISALADLLAPKKQ